VSGIDFTTPSVTASHTNFSGGLNSTAGPLTVADNESSDLQNVDFNKFGSVLKRNGYAVLGEGPIGTASLSLDGTDDSLSLSDHAGWDIFGTSTASYTIDLWVKHDAASPSGHYLTQREDGSNKWEFAYSSGVDLNVEAGGVEIIGMNGGTISDTSWHHVAMCKVGNDHGLYLDGTQTAYTSDTSQDTFAGYLNIGTNGASGAYFDGNMAHIRVNASDVFSATPVVGLTDTITVPTAQPTSDANTKLLLNFNDADEATSTTDISHYAHTINFNNEAAIDASNYKFGNVTESDGLHWYEYETSGTQTRELVAVTNAKFFKMDDLDGDFDEITGTLTITAQNHCDFENFLNEVYVTNGTDPPFLYNGTSAAQMNVPSGLTDAKYVKQYNNYLFLANVIVSGTSHQSRIYWSNIKDTDTWTATDFIDVAKNDGQQITGLRVLSDRLVIFKERSIYNLFFTGDADIPFILPGGGKSNSAVGCVAPFSIQEVENGLVFLSVDGFYYYDGNNSFKISDKITTTLLGYNTSRFNQARSLVQKDKNRYWCAMVSSGETENDRVVVWDWFNNAWTVYVGLAAAAMTTVFVNGKAERPYFGDYGGFYYRADSGTDDNPAGTETAIDGYYRTNWKSYGDLVDKKGISHVTLYYQTGNNILTFTYTYDLENGDQYNRTIDLSTSTSTYGGSQYGSGTYASEGGGTTRLDLTSRGKLVRFKFANSTVGEGFQIDGMGTLPHLETKT
jgi:hypothetical protein